MSIDRELNRAKRHAKKGESAEAERLYKGVLDAYPGNKRAINGLATLRKSSSITTGITQTEMDKLVHHYNQGNLDKALELGENAALRYPEESFVYNLLGAVHKRLGHISQAIASYQKALKIKPDYAEARNNLGAVFLDTGQLQEALQQFIQAAKDDTNYAAANNNAALSLIYLGRPEDALPYCAKALEQKADFAEAYNNRGIALRALGSLQEAIACFQKAASVRPDYAEAHNNAGVTYKDLGNTTESITSCERALSIRPDYAEAHNNLGGALSDAGKVEESVASYQAAIRLNPDYAEAYNNLGFILNLLGEQEAAKSSYETALQIKPDYCEAYRNLSVIKRFYATDPMIGRLENLGSRKDISDGERMFASYALAKARSDTGDHAGSFEMLETANQLRKQQLAYDISSDRNKFTKIKQLFDEEIPNWIPGNNDAEKAHAVPIFIVGMPRTGSSLVEQILASLPSVHGAGELELINQLATPLLQSTAIDASTIASVRQQYLNATRELAAPHDYFTDKMPFNFMWLGFVLTALPEAKVVHVKRDPHATCWSNYKHYFAAQGLGYAYDQGDVAMYYREYEDLMAFWRKRFPGRIFELSYEQLTEEQEQMSRQLLAHVGLAWDERCLDFHKTDRAVRTASAAQVRKAMYQGSSGEWLKYKPFLQPMLDALEGRTELDGTAPTQQQVDHLIGLYNLTRYQDAATEGEKLLSQFPDSPFLHNFLGTVHKALGDNAQAITRYNKALRLNPEYAEVHNNLGTVLAEKGEYDEAIASYSHAVSYHPDYAEAYNNLGVAHLDTDRPEQAAGFFQKAVTINPRFTEALVNLSITLHRQGKDNEARAYCKTALAIQPDMAKAHDTMGTIYQSEENFDEAVNSFKQALSLNNNNAATHNNLALAYLSSGNTIEARSACAEALRLQPGFATALNTLGNISAKDGLLTEAKGHYEQALKIDPELALAHNNLGAILIDLGQSELAIASCKSALKYNPGYAEAHNTLGNALLGEGDSHAAVFSFRQAIENKADYAEAHNNLGIALSEIGDTTAAITMVEEALQIKPDHAQAHRNLSTLKRYEPDDLQILHMESLLKNEDLSDSDRMNLCFALGKAYHDIGSYARAYECWRQGNQLRKRNLQYDISMDIELFHQIRSLFENQQNQTSHTPTSTIQQPSTPVFVLGMPRSGTSLVEQILASHSQVYGAGELNLLTRAIHRHGWPWQSVNEQTLRPMADEYQSGMRKLDAGEPYITDKMPLNFRWIGFILSALPHAKIIHIQRDPRATCWSIFRQYFSADGNGFAYDMEDIATFYRHYTALMNFWHDHFPGHIHDVKYEVLTEDQELITRGMLEYLQLDWEPQCLDFANTDRAIRTASATQVRQGMYRGSSDEWRHYAEWIDPLLKQL